MLKGYVNHENIYYEAMGKINQLDVEVPLRRPQNVAPPMLTSTQPPSTTVSPTQNLPPYWNYQNTNPSLAQPPADKGMFANIGWKDLVTFIYFLSGVAALWINMSERTLIIEHRVNSIEREGGSTKETVKELQLKADSQIRAAEKEIAELRYDMLKHGKRE